MTEQRPDWQCPFCGQRMCRAQISTSSGLRETSLCCDMPLEFIDNYDVFSGLPANLQQLAIRRKKDEYAAMDARDAELQDAFKQSSDKWIEEFISSLDQETQRNQGARL